MTTKIKTRIIIDGKANEVAVEYWKPWFWFFGEWVPWGSTHVGREVPQKITNREIVGAIYDKIDKLDERTHILPSKFQPTASPITAA